MMAGSENQGDWREKDMDEFEAITSRSTAKRLASIISKFDNLKRKLVMEIGFGGLLHLPQINISQRKFTVWLLAHIDTDKRAIVVNDQETLHLTERDVEFFFGIPCGPNQLYGIDTNSVEDKLDFIRLSIGSISNDPEEFNSLKVAEQVITKEYLMEWIKLHLIDYWGSLLELDKLQSFNFCKMVIDEIIESAIKVQYHLKANKPIPILSGCSLFLQGFYLIMRTLKIEKPVDNVPLIAGLDYENIKKMMMADKEARRMMAEVGSASSSGVSGTPFIDRKQDTKSAPRCESLDLLGKPILNSFLDSYIRRDTDRKLTVPQVMDLKWHNARMIYHITAMKKLTEESTYIPQVGVSGGLIAHSQAVQASKEKMLKNLDALLVFILEDNVKLANKLHQHATVEPMSNSSQTKDQSSCKRSASNRTYNDSSSECSSVNKRVALGQVEAHRTIGHDVSSFQTPLCTKENVALSPVTSVRHVSESGLLYRILEAEDRFNLNARSLENEFIDSPIEKIRVKQEQVAKNPWVYGVQRKPMTCDYVEKTMVWLVYTNSDELDRIWIMHTHPRYIDITGHALKNIIILGLPFTYELFDICARRLAQLDRWMYGPGTKLCFCHIFESDFAMMVLANEDALSFRSIRDQFTDSVPYYDISECCLLSVPALVRETWCGYLWDIQLQCVHIVDPKFNRSREEELKTLHDYNVNKIKKVLHTCISTLFADWNLDFGEWPHNYIKPIIAGGSNQQSGILTLLAIKDFNGAGFVTEHTEVTCLLTLL